MYEYVSNYVRYLNTELYADACIPRGVLDAWVWFVLYDFGSKQSEIGSALSGSRVDRNAPKRTEAAAVRGVADSGIVDNIRERARKGGSGRDSDVPADSSTLRSSLLDSASFENSKFVSEKVVDDKLE